MGEGFKKAARMIISAVGVLAVCTGGEHSFKKYHSDSPERRQEIKWEFSDFYDYNPLTGDKIEITDRRALLALNEGLDTHSMRKSGEDLFYNDKEKFRWGVLYDAKRLGYDAKRIGGLSIKESALLACKLIAERFVPSDNPLLTIIDAARDSNEKVDVLYNKGGRKSCIGYSKVAKGIMMDVLKPMNSRLENIHVSCYGSDSAKFWWLRYHISNQIVNASRDGDSLTFDTSFFDTQKYDGNGGRSANGYLELLMGKNYVGLEHDVREFERGR